MYCPNCGNYNNAGNFCYNCGTVLKNSNVNTTNNNINDYNTVSLILGIVCLVMSFFAGVLCIIPGIISIIFAVKNKKNSGKLGVGFGLSLGGIIFCVLLLVFWVSFFSFVIDNYYNSTNYNDNYEYEEIRTEDYDFY